VPIAHYCRICSKNQALCRADKNIATPKAVTWLSVHVQLGVSGDDVKVHVGMEQCQIVANRYGGYEAVDEFARGGALSPTSSIERCCRFVVGRLGKVQSCHSQEAAEILEMPFVTGSREYFHPHRFAGCKLAVEKFVNPLTGRASGIA
jgi:hypothetical protein